MSKREIQNKFSNENNMYYGHGTGEKDMKKVESIFKNGLRCSHEQLYFTTEILGQGSKDLFKNIEDELDNWKHLDSRQIVIASLPLEYHMLDQMGTPFYGKKHEVFCYEISEEEAEKMGIVSGKYLKPEFIMGVYDSDNSQFVSNGNYYENLPKEEQEIIINEAKKKYINLIKESGISVFEYLEILKDANFPMPLTKEEVIEIEMENIQTKLINTQITNFTGNSEKTGGLDKIFAEIFEENSNLSKSGKVDDLEK